MREYRVHRVATEGQALAFDHPLWSKAEPLAIDCFRPESSDHRPHTRSRLLHTGDSLLGLFEVDDRYVRCVHQGFQDPVYEDSCVEVFLQPRPGRGYLNFEMNCGGALLATHITNHRRVPGGFAAFTRLRSEDARLVSIRPSLPPIVDPEIDTPVDWRLSFRLPVGLLERYVGLLGDLSGQSWRANLFKCGDRTSHPHWASWSAVDALNFHLPHCFGRLSFD